MGHLSKATVHVEGEGSSSAITRLKTKIRLTGFRTRDLSRSSRRALYRRTGKQRVSFSGFSPLNSNHDITTTPPPDSPRTASRLRIEGEGSSWAVIRQNTKIGLAGFRTRDLLRIRRALYRRTGKQKVSFSGFSQLSSNHDIHLRTLPRR
jgi:predicted DNA-binding helix-hairpin-helix protein